MRITIIYEHNGEGQSVAGFTDDNTLWTFRNVVNELIDRIHIATDGNGEILGIETETNR